MLKFGPIKKKEDTWQFSSQYHLEGKGSGLIITLLICVMWSAQKISLKEQVGVLIWVLTCVHCNTYSCKVSLFLLIPVSLSIFMRHIEYSTDLKTFSADWHAWQYQFWIKCATSATYESAEVQHMNQALVILLVQDTTQWRNFFLFPLPPRKPQSPPPLLPFLSYLLYTLVPTPMYTCNNVNNDCHLLLNDE